MNSSLLWALLALAVPIIIHLFHFRRYKKVQFSNTRFLFEAHQVQKNASRLKHLLVLMTRLLAFTFIIFAFAQPFWKADKQGQRAQQHLSLFIDNSFSMESVGQQLTLLEEAKELGVKTIQSFPNDMNFHVFDHNFKSIDQRWLSKDQAIARVRDSDLTGAVNNLKQISARQDQMNQLSDENDIKRIVLTDGQKNIYSNLPEVDSLYDMQIVQLNAVQQPNVAIDSCWFEDPVLLPKAISNLYVKMTNYGRSEARNIRLSLDYEGQVRPAGTFNIAANETILDTIPMTHKQTGWKSARVHMEEHPVLFDNDLYLTFPVVKEIKVLYVGSEAHAPFFRAVYRGNGFTNFEQKAVSKLVYSDFPKYQLIIVDDLRTISSGLSTELLNYMEAGGNVLLFPSDVSNLSTYNPFLRAVPANEFVAMKVEKQEIYDINKRSFIFKNVYKRTRSEIKTPTVERYFDLKRRPIAEKEILMKFRNDKTYLAAYKKGSGHLYLAAAPSDDAHSDIMNKGAFFVPMLNRMCISSSGSIRPFYSVGNKEVVRVSNSNFSNDPVYKITGKTEIIPAAYNTGKYTLLNTKEQITSAGIYDLSLGDSTLAKLAFNYNRTESDLSSIGLNEVERMLPKGIRVVAGTNDDQTLLANVGHNQSKPLWIWCIIFALISLLIEQILLRLFK